MGLRYTSQAAGSRVHPASFRSPELQLRVDSIYGTGTTNRGSPIPDEKRTLIDTDASQHRFTLMIFQIFHPCESVFPPSCLRAVVSSWFLPRYVTTGYSIYGTGATNRGSPITDEKRTLIDTDASHRRLTLMIFIYFYLRESAPICVHLRSLFSEQHGCSAKAVPGRPSANGRPPPSSEHFPPRPNGQ